MPARTCALQNSCQACQVPYPSLALPLCSCPRPAIPPVGHVEGLLHSITMVHINVYVQHPRMVLEQLKDGKDQVIDVAEARGL